MYNKEEKKNYLFKAFDSKGNEIDMRCGMKFYDVTEMEASGIRLGIEIGLMQKYSEPYVIKRVVD